MSGRTALPSPYTSQVDIGAARSVVEDLVCGMPGGDLGQRGFDHPWEIRAFAMAVAAHKALGFDWAEFQQSLISSIQDWESDGGVAAGEDWSYYRHWVTALESVMGRAGVLEDADLDARAHQILAIPANRNHHEAHTEPIAVDHAHVVPA